MDQKLINILLIDDRSQLRKVIELFLQLQTGMKLIAVADDIEDIKPLLRRKQPTVILLSLRASTRSDIDCLQILVPEVPVILMGFLKDFLINAPSLRRGLDSYIDKSMLIDTLIPEIRRCANGKNFLR